MNASLAQLARARNLYSRGRWFESDKRLKKGSYQSGQMGLTVTQLAFAFGGSNPSLPTKKDLKGNLSGLFCFYTHFIAS